MSILKDGKEYEYNIDGDLVPEGSVTQKNMYGDFENRYVSGRKPVDPEWRKAVDTLFDVIDPLVDPSKEKTEEEREEAIDEFFKQAAKQGE